MQDGDEFNKAKGKPKARAASLATGVNGFNYVELAGAFIKANGGSGFMICQRSGTTKGPDKIPLEADLRKWGAWMVYFKRIGRSRPTRKLIDRADYQMVPAEWPHLFDAEATVAADHLAADAFVAERARQDNRQFDTQRVISDTARAMDSADYRRGVVTSALGYDPSKLRAGERPPLLGGRPSGFRPYPRLWEAFANDAQMTELLDSGLPFDFVTEASKRLATVGKDEAARYLKSFHQRSSPAAPEPVAKEPLPQSSADLKTPSAPPSAALLKALKAQNYPFPRPRPPEDPDT